MIFVWIFEYNIGSKIKEQCILSEGNPWGYLEKCFTRLRFHINRAVKNEKDFLESLLVPNNFSPIHIRPLVHVNDKFVAKPGLHQRKHVPKLLNEWLENFLDELCLHPRRQSLIKIELFNDHVVVILKRIFERLPYPISHWTFQKVWPIHVLNPKDKPSVHRFHPFLNYGQKSLILVIKQFAENNDQVTLNQSWYELQKDHVKVFSATSIRVSSKTDRSYDCQDEIESVQVEFADRNWGVIVNYLVEDRSWIFRKVGSFNKYPRHRPIFDLIILITIDVIQAKIDPNTRQKVRWKNEIEDHVTNDSLKPLMFLTLLVVNKKYVPVAKIFPVQKTNQMKSLSIKHSPRLSNVYECICKEKWDEIYQKWKRKYVLFNCFGQSWISHFSGYLQKAQNYLNKPKWFTYDQNGPILKQINVFLQAVCWSDQNWNGQIYRKC